MFKLAVVVPPAESESLSSPISSLAIWGLKNFRCVSEAYLLTRVVVGMPYLIVAAYLLVSGRMVMDMLGLLDPSGARK